MIAVFEAIAGFGNSWALNATENSTSIIIAISSAFPLVTMLLGYIFLKERLVLNQYIGAFMIIGGIATFILV